MDCIVLAVGTLSNCPSDSVIMTAVRWQLRLCCHIWPEVVTFTFICHL